MLQESALDYERLVAQYQHDLFHLLRGHCSLDYLEIWVPDEDPVKSLLNMVEAAQSCGRELIVVDVGSETVARLDTGLLLDSLSCLGSATVTPIDGGLRLTVATLRDPQRAAAPYRSGLDARATSIRFAGAVADDASGEVFARTLDGVTLSVRVDGDGIVTEALHLGAAGSVRAALDVLCEIMCGRPFVEAAEHGVIRLEAALREPSLPLPMPGIINAEVADPIFAAIQKIVRALYAGYCKTRVARPPQNTYAEPPRAAWSMLSGEAKLCAARDAVCHALVALQAPADGARVLAIEHDDRVMIAFTPAVERAAKPRLALRLEIALQSHCDPTLQVFLADVKDENAARRL